MNTKLAVLLLCTVTTLSGCLYPSEDVQTIESRPMIMFKTTLDADEINVFVDNIKAGKVSDFLRNKAALRVVPGTHIIRIEKPDHTVQVEKIYVGDGVIKTIVVP